MRRLLLGASALVLLAAGCALPGRTTGPLELTATFADVGDLFENHAVQMADVRVGSIDKIELTDDYQAVVTMSVKDLELPAGRTMAILRQTSLLGEKFIELRPMDGARAGDCPCIEDGDTIEVTQQAPELEFFAEQAVELLAGVVTNDLVTLIETGAIGFGGRGPELQALITELGTISATLADQSSQIVGIIDGLDVATSTLAASAPDLDQLLVNLAGATTTLAENRQQAIATLEQLTRLARVQNTEVFDPYFDQVQLQIQQLDRIVAELAEGREEVGVLLEWAEMFVSSAPLAIPFDFAQIYMWGCPALFEDCRG